MNKIAYLIQAHNDADHLYRLVKALNYDADFYIHIDKKSEISLFEDKLHGDNINFLPQDKRVKVFWGDFSQVKATLNLIEACLDYASLKSCVYKKIVFMSGVCYPIKDNKFIHQFFVDHPNVNFIRGMNITEADSPKYNYCICNYLFFGFKFINEFTTRIIRKLLYFIFNLFRQKKNYLTIKGKKNSIFHGSSWWAVNMDVLKYMYDYGRSNSEINRYFKYSLASDEKYFHTIFFNSKFSKTNLFAGQEPFVPITAAFANLHIIDSSLTKWFDVDDYYDIQRSDKLFVRKVSISKSSALLDRIDKELLVLKR